MEDQYKKAAELIKKAEYAVAFTGAGISVESGIPPFRGEGGLWSKYDPTILELDYYKTNTTESWKVIKKLFYDFFGSAKPNDAHNVIGRLEKQGYVKAVITQNIDNLHQEGGSKNVLEFHGNSQWLVCTKCKYKIKADEFNLDCKYPVCPVCNGLMKPDFIFFGEAIPEPAASLSYKAAKECDVMLLIGTTGEVVPASYIPYEAKRNGAKIIEVNPGISAFSRTISDVQVREKASSAMIKIEKELDN